MSDSTDKLNLDSTAILPDGTAKLNDSQGAGQSGVVTIFADGQALVLNGKNCVIEKLISMGSGEAVVYKIQIDGKPYVLKHYKPNTPLSDTAKKVLAKIRDKPQERIIKIFDFGSYNGQDFEIMEYAEGGTLGEYIKKNGATRDANLKSVVKQINEGLQQLHGYYRVIWQDLKPENIFFRDAARTSLVLADFGISSVMQEGKEEAEVIFNSTDLYGAPELAIKAADILAIQKGHIDDPKVFVTPAVDYFALGMTVYELWLGEQPFKGIVPKIRERHILNKDIDFPIDMPDDCKTLIQGLLDPAEKYRMGNEHIQKWLKGETLAPASKKPSAVASTVYKPLKFGNEFASNPKEMAALMEKYPEAGKTSLYKDFITQTLKEANDVTLFTEIENVIAQYGNDRGAGLIAAIYTLDPEKPFVSRKGKACKNSEEIADAIMDDSAHYMEDLKNPNAGLYVYIAVTGGSHGKEVADSFCKYFEQYPPNRALTLIYLKLQNDGGVGIGSKRYLSADELMQEEDSTQIELIKKAVREKDSPLLVWLSDEYGDYFKSTDEFNKLGVSDQFFLLGILPFLSYKELTGSNGEAALKDLIDNYPGHSYLFEAYAAQGLPLKGPMLDHPVRMTPIDYVVCKLIAINRKHSDTTINDLVYILIRLLHKIGADVNEYSSDSTCPLQNAYEANFDDLVNLLLELGADRDKYNELVAQRAEEERIEAENKRKEAERQAEQARIERERQAEQARKERERQAEEDRLERRYRAEREKERAREKRAKKVGRGFLIFLSMAPSLITALMTVIGYRYASLHSYFSSDISFVEAIVIFVAILIPFAILLFFGEIGFLKVISIIVISFLLLAGLGTAVDFDEYGHFGWITLVLGIFAFVMALVKPTFDVIADVRSANKYADNPYSPYNNVVWNSVDSAYMERYLKEKARKTIFKTIVTVAAVSVVLLTAGLIVYNSQKNSLSIPVGVTSIENREYTRKQLVNVEIPDGVTTIGKESFKTNKLSDIEIPDSVTSIGDSAFVNNRLTTITIGANVTLGSNVFDSGFDEFYINNGSSAGTYTRYDRKSLDWSAWHNNFKFQYNDGTISITGYGGYDGSFFDLVIPEEISGYHVTIIGNRAFNAYYLTSVTIPNSVTIIEEQAFPGGWYNNSPTGRITSLTIGTGVTTIENGAFRNNRLSTIVIPNNVTSIGVNAFSGNPVTSIRLGANVELGDADGNYGILGQSTGFNSAYANNGMRAGTYTRPNTGSTTWTRR